MKIAVGSDMDSHLVGTVVDHLREMGHAVTTFGAIGQPTSPWPKVAIEVAEKVAAGQFDQAVLFCWTGTGISIAANKVKGIRAALCHDAETAAGARKWNDANVLAMSLRSTSDQVGKEILEAWFANEPSEEAGDQICLEFLEAAEHQRFKA